MSHAGWHRLLWDRRMSRNWEISSSADPGIVNTPLEMLRHVTQKLGIAARG
jgi:hypothetical protein